LLVAPATNTEDQEIRRSGDQKIRRSEDQQGHSRF